MIEGGIAPAIVIIKIIQSLPASEFIMAIILITMIGLYASTFDALTDVMSAFSYKKLDVDIAPSKSMKIYWACIFLVLPLCLLFLDSTNQLLMSISIIGAFPISIIMILIVVAFIKDVRRYFKEKDTLLPAKTEENVQRDFVDSSEKAILKASNEL